MENSDDLWPPWSEGYAQRRHADRRRPHGPGTRSGPDPQAGLDPGSGPGPGQGRGPGGQRGGPPRGRARQRPALSRDEIVDAAIAIADAEGPDAVSMRRIAQVLRAGTMSLYWHIANKEHLVDLMLDALFAEVEVPEPSGNWQADLRAYARSTRAVLLRHRWVIDFIGGRPGMGPNTLRSIDRSIALLDGLPLDLPTKLTILQSVTTYVTGAAVRELQELRVQRQQEEQPGASPEDMQAEARAWRARLEQAGGFEHFIQIFEQNLDPDARETREDRFAFGLHCLLDGIAVHVRGLSRPVSPDNSGNLAVRD
ncbi:MAG TPA: TetR/AcrR family transcriptional regulator [Streptosporangiaceae bacterium]|nr:TetR/AcrR family transcriptional regulator [Streptosporangiaceae bacterium]